MSDSKKAYKNWKLKKGSDIIFPNQVWDAACAWQKANVNVSEEYNSRLVEVLTDLLEFEGSYSPCEIEMARAYAEAHKALLEMQDKKS
jgi:hypothetical protein